MDSKKDTIPGQTSPLVKERVIFKSLVIDTLFWFPSVILALLSGSVTLYTDAIKKGNEILSTFFSWLALKKMVEGGANTYDYGMGKFESITGIITGVVMFLSLVLVFAHTVYNLLNPGMLHEESTIIAMIVLIIGVCVSTVLWREKVHIAKNEYSPVLEAQITLFKTKAGTDLIVLIALILAVLFEHHSWAEYIDPLASFIVIGSFLISGYRTISTSLPDLLDRTIEEELQLVVVRSLADFFDEYEAFHGIRSRKSGNFIYIELFLEFDEEKKLKEIQSSIDKIKESLEKEIPRSSVTIMPCTGKFGCRRKEKD
ncbi:MAG: cation diffusion facilitator family transporter [Methanomicrobiales archaeon]|nr:cation diffusion facilitator family transporter [Methanomicrobiales archaeon]